MRVGVVLSRFVTGLQLIEMRLLFSRVIQLFVERVFGAFHRT